MAKQQKLELTWYNKDKALIPLEDGQYGYAWVDVHDPRYCQTRPIVVTETVTGKRGPREAKKQYSPLADLEPTHDNLMIQGDSGDALEALTRVPELVDEYVGKVKCIYIDPPFNTDQTFDHYEDNLEHSVWLTMMRDRLLHMRDLLSRDGSIWVHLDDVENHRMRMLLDEVFGPENFMGEVVWKKRSSFSNDSIAFTSQHDVLIVYGRSHEAKLNRLPRPLTKDDLRYKSVDGDPKLWGAFGNTSANGGITPAGNQAGGSYGIQHPFTGEVIYPPKGKIWRFGRDTIVRCLNEFYETKDCPPDLELRMRATGLDMDHIRTDTPDLMVADLKEAAETTRQRLDQGLWPEFYVQATTFGRKTYKSEGTATAPASTWWPDDLVGHNREAKNEIKKLFANENPFSTPKPERLLERVLKAATEPGDIVLDVFAGSGTTAAVAQKMGRRWLVVELRQDTFNRFTRPRLSKVVNNEDEGGITITEEREFRDGVRVPDGFVPKKVEESEKLLRALAKMDHISPEQQAHIKETMKLIATKKSTVRNWTGGGSFKVAHLAPVCFDFDPEVGLTYLTSAASGKNLVHTIAANLGFYLGGDDPYFDGYYNRKRLAVVEGLLDRAKVDEIMSHLPDGSGVEIAALAVDDGVRDYVSSFQNGSRVIHVPFGLFPYAPESPETDEKVVLTPPDPDIATDDLEDEE